MRLGLIFLVFIVSFYTMTAITDYACRKMGFYDIGTEESMEIQRGLK